MRRCGTESDSSGDTNLTVPSSRRSSEPFFQVLPDERLISSSRCEPRTFESCASNSNDCRSSGIGRRCGHFRTRRGGTRDARSNTFRCDAHGKSRSAGSTDRCSDRRCRDVIAELRDRPGPFHPLGDHRRRRRVLRKQRSQSRVKRRKRRRYVGRSFIAGGPVRPRGRGGPIPSDPRSLPRDAMEHHSRQAVSLPPDLTRRSRRRKAIARPGLTQAATTQGAGARARPRT